MVLISSKALREHAFDLKRPSGCLPPSGYGRKFSSNLAEYKRWDVCASTNISILRMFAREQEDNTEKRIPDLGLFI